MSFSFFLEKITLVSSIRIKIMTIGFMDLYKFAFKISSKAGVLDSSTLRAYGRKFLTWSMNAKITSFFFIRKINLRTSTFIKITATGFMNLYRFSFDVGLQSGVLDSSVLRAYRRKFITRSRSTKVTSFVFLLKIKHQEL